MFRAHVLIISRSKLYYTTSGIITPLGDRPVHRLWEDLCTGRPPIGVMIPDAVWYTVAQKERIFSNNCNFFIFNIKNYVNTKKPLINAVLITYIDYSITENYIGKMASFLPYSRPEPLLKVLLHIY